MLFEDLFGCCRERRDRKLGLALVGERVPALTRDLPVTSGLLACFVQRNQADAAQADIAPLAFDDRSQDPPLGAGGIDHEIKTVAVGVTPGRLQLPHMNGAQRLFRVPPTPFAHRPPNSATNISYHNLYAMEPTFNGRIWMVNEITS